jgi:hypothetical protein
MFHSFQLITTLSTDRRARFGNAATRRRLVRGNQLSPARSPSTAAPSVAWPEDIDRAVTQQRAHCAA